MSDKPVDPNTINMTKRERIIYKMLSRINTLEELDAITKEVSEWVLEHPNDDEIYGNAESLLMLRGYFK